MAYNWRKETDVSEIEPICRKFLGHLDQQSGPRVIHGRFHKWGVTGATGWLGRHAARHILRNGGSVVAMTRIQNQEHAEKACLDAIIPPGNVSVERQALHEGWRDRIEVGAGCFHRDTHFTPVDAIFHAAADTSWLQPLPESIENHLWNDLWVCFWAQSVQAKRIDFVSSLSVWVGSERGSGICYEDDPLCLSQKMRGSYAAVKWAQDYFFQHANLGGTSCATHRVGLLLASQDEGWPEHCQAAHILKTSARRGFHQNAPENEHLFFDWSPTDLVVQGIFAAAANNAQGACSHNANTPLSYNLWREALISLYGVGVWDQKTDKQAYRAMGRALPGSQHPGWADLFQMDRHIFDRTQAKKWGAPIWDAPLDTKQIEEFVKRHPPTK